MVQLSIKTKNFGKSVLLKPFCRIGRGVAPPPAEQFPIIERRKGGLTVLRKKYTSDEEHDQPSCVNILLTTEVERYCFN